MKTARPNGSRGFTLVEIMIVVGIIALLCAMVIPNYVRARANAQASACINNLRQIDSAVHQFAIETGKRTGDVITYPNDITPYLKLNSTGQIPSCPAGGVYTVNAIGTIPSALCSLGSSVNPPHIQQ